MSGSSSVGQRQRARAAALAGRLVVLGGAERPSTALKANFSDPSRVFSTTLPVKPSVTTTSTRSVMTSRPSTLPMKRTAGPGGAGGQQGVGLLDQGVPLAGLLADRQQADPGVGDPEALLANADPIWANWTSQAALHSALAPASSSTVGVEPGHRDGRGDGRTGHAGEAAHPQQGAGHGRPGVAGAHHGRGPTVADRLGRPHEGRVLLVRTASGGVLVHLDDLASGR